MPVKRELLLVQRRVVDKSTVWNLVWERLYHYSYLPVADQELAGVSVARSVTARTHAVSAIKFLVDMSLLPANSSSRCLCNIWVTLPLVNLINWLTNIFSLNSSFLSSIADSLKFKRKAKANNSRIQQCQWCSRRDNYITYDSNFLFQITFITQAQQSREFSARI